MRDIRCVGDVNGRPQPPADTMEKPALAQVIGRCFRGASVASSPPVRHPVLDALDPEARGFMKSISVGALSLAAVLALPSVAHAQDKKDCEPGSWFCGETQPPPAGGGKDLQPLPSDSAKPAD